MDFLWHSEPYTLLERVAVIRRAITQRTHANHSAVNSASHVKKKARFASTPIDETFFRVDWICGSLIPSETELARIRQQGGVVQVIDSLAALGAQRSIDPEVTRLVLVDLSTALTDAMQACLEISQKTSLHAMTLVVLGDEVAEEDMMRCVLMGAVKMVSRTHAAQSVCEIAEMLFGGTDSSPRKAASQASGIHAQAAMDRMQADQKFFAKLLRYFFDELPQHRQALHEAWSHEPEQVKNRCHSLKGLASTLGIERLAEVSRKGEFMGPYLEATEIENVALLQQLDHEIQSARFDILRLLTLNQQTKATMS